jgi:hypothetical protein
MSDVQSAREQDGALYRVFRCFGREFPVYYQYSDEDGNAIPNYPDFEAAPQYTSEGRPFALVSQEGCDLRAPDTPDGASGVECGSCEFFRSGAGFSLFGICMNEQRRQPQAKKEE